MTNAVAAAAVQKTGGGDERVDAGPSTATKSDRGGSSSQHEETHPDHARERDEVATEAARGTGRRREGNGKRRGEKNGTRDKRFVCPVKECGKMFWRGEHLQRHIRSIHTGEKREFFFLSKPLSVRYKEKELTLFHFLFPSSDSFPMPVAGLWQVLFSSR